MSGAGTTQRFYGRWTRLYDRLASAPGVTGWRRRAVDALDLEPGGTVVEMGCGTGANLPLLRDRVGASGTVVGLDLTRPMLATAQSRVERAGWANVHLARADATDPPLRGAGTAASSLAGGVDAVLGTFVVGMFPDPAPVVDEWCDLVETGGRVTLLNFQRSDHRLGRALNPAFAAFVWLASPGSTLPNPLLVVEFERRVRAAREALVNRTTGREYESFAGGFLGLVSGTVTN